MRRVLVILDRGGLRSEPPPNQCATGVQNIRVFMCTAGTWGFCMWATRLMPEAQKVGSSLSPSMFLREDMAGYGPVTQLAVDRGDVHAHLLEDAPPAHDAHQAAARIRSVLGAALCLRHLEPAGGRVAALRVLQRLEGRDDVVTQAPEPGRSPGFCGRRKYPSSGLPPSLDTSLVFGSVPLLREKNQVNNRRRGRVQAEQPPGIRPDRPSRHSTAASHIRPWIFLQT